MHNFWRNLVFPWLSWPSLRQPQNFIPPPPPLFCTSFVLHTCERNCGHSEPFLSLLKVRVRSSVVQLWFGLSIGKRLGLPSPACAMGGYSTDLTTPAIWTREFLDLSDSFQRYLTDKLTVCCCPHSKIRTSHGLFRMPFSLHLWTLNICSLDTETALLRTKDRMSKMEQDRVLKMYNCVRFVSSDLSLDNLVRYQRMTWHVA